MIAEFFVYACETFCRAHLVFPAACTHATRAAFEISFAHSAFFFLHVKGLASSLCQLCPPFTVPQTGHTHSTSSGRVSACAFHSIVAKRLFHCSGSAKRNVRNGACAYEIRASSFAKVRIWQARGRAATSSSVAAEKEAAAVAL